MSSLSEPIDKTTMQSAKQRLSGIEAAKVELGNPKRVWFRGHGSEHHLLPSLFRFPGGEEGEQRVLERFRHHTSNVSPKPLRGRLGALLAMHDSYVPTRVLAWTERLDVALFCALVRESDHPTVFVLDPVALNAISNVAGVVTLDSKALEDFGLSSWTNQLALPGSPLAVDTRSPLEKFPERETVYTVHGKDKLPLEQQCAHCVRKVVLSDEERFEAVALVLNRN